MRQVLIVEDDSSMSVALRDGFEYEGYEVTMVHDGETALEVAVQDPPDLMILDVMLPRKTGLDVCKELRSSGSRVPIIMLTARGQEIDKVLGLKLGADDYVTKPFGFMELMARAEAVLRRSGNVPPTLETLVVGNLRVDFTAHTAHRNGSSLKLSPREFQLLEYFGQHAGRVVTRDELLEAVWGYESIPFTRTVDMHIAKLRKKIEDDPANPRHIVTVHGLGYRFTA